MKRKIVVLWIISYLAVSSAKAQFNTVSDNVCRYKVRKVEEKFLLRAKNEPAYAMMDGIVEKVGYDNRSGNYVTLRHVNYHVSYCHLSSVIVDKGERVFSGTIIGITGNSGRSTCSHLHLTCKKDGKSINPTILFSAITSCE